MGYIYKISNDINPRVYIGQTTQTLAQRWAQHISVSINNVSPEYDYAIHKAIRKHGVQHFTITAIEECADTNLNEREVFWIQQYDSYLHGYNMTLGGNDPPHYTRPVRCVELNVVYASAREAARQLNLFDSNIWCCCAGVYMTCGGYHWCWETDWSADWKPREQKQKKMARCITTGKIYESTIAAERDTGCNHTKISACCRGKNKTVHGFRWEYYYKDTKILEGE